MPKTRTGKKPARRERTHVPNGATELLVGRFQGRRFADHGFDLRDFADLSALREVVVGTAKQLWRNANPTRDNLPAHFEDRVRIKIFTIERGSAQAHIYAVVDERDEQQGVPQIADALEIRPKVVDAARLVVRTLRAVSRSETSPPEATREFVARLAALRSSLVPDETVYVDGFIFSIHALAFF